MREIKFRAWDKNEKIMLEVVRLTFARMNGKLTYIELWNPQDIDGLIRTKFPRDVILMQYTGLKDKNGVEIYEGDVLQIPDSTIIEEVIWENNMWTEEGFMTGFGELTFTLDQYEIIGNIYENPELLEEK